MTDQKRPYRKQRRAELEQGTRRRITESAVELHGTLGPSRTSLSAVAAHAGVRRSTLYRHFPDEAALFAACTEHWMTNNPLPDLARWAATDDPDRRLRMALQELYAHYARTERMMDNILRDEATVPLVKQMFQGFHDYIDAAHRILMAADAPRRRPSTRERRGRPRTGVLHLALTDPRASTRRLAGRRSHAALGQRGFRPARQALSTRRRSTPARAFRNACGPIASPSRPREEPGPRPWQARRECRASAGSARRVVPRRRLPPDGHR